MRKPDHGLSEHDLEVFTARLLADAVEKAWIHKHSQDDDERYELEDGILETLVSVYMLQMWMDVNLGAEDEESQTEDFD